MDQFERQFEHLDVQTQTMEEAMSGVTTLTIPEVSPTSSLTGLFIVDVILGPSHWPHARSIR